MHFRVVESTGLSGSLRKLGLSCLGGTQNEDDRVKGQGIIPVIRCSEKIISNI